MVNALYVVSELTLRKKQKCCPIEQSYLWESLLLAKNLMLLVEDDVTPCFFMYLVCQCLEHC